MPILTEADPDVIDGVYYPSEDGKPMAETNVHLLALFQLFQLLKFYYEPRADVFVAGDMYWYWERGNPKARIAPDIMVNFGVVQNELRNSFMSWLENGVIPSVTFEMAAKGTWRKNLTKTKDTYERRGVKEYFIFDPLVQFLEAPLIGFRLRGKRYMPIAAQPDGSMISRELGVRLRPQGWHLRLVDLITGELVPTAEERAAREAERAEEEKRRAEEEKRRAEEEKRRADALQDENARLRAQLQQKNGKNGNLRGNSP